jgi:hypothetical protein
MPDTHEPELTRPCVLADERGHLRREAVGWARRPLWSSALAGRWGRRKRWCYWAVLDPRFFLAITIADLDYVGATLIDLESHRRVERVVPCPLGRGVSLPDGLAGSIRFHALGLHLAVDDDGRDVRLRARYLTLGGGRVDADVRASRPEGADTLDVVIPWSDRCFQLTGKHIGLRARGSVNLRGETFELGPHARASLDFGRGVWPYRTRWNWAAASGEHAGRDVALNLGGQWTRGTGMTENGVVVGGRLHKIGTEVTFDRDPGRPDAPWHLHDGTDGRVDLTFTPVYAHHVRVPAVVVASELDHAIGTFEGTLGLDGGERIEVRGMRGWAEEHVARW